MFFLMKDGLSNCVNIMVYPCCMRTSVHKCIGLICEYIAQDLVQPWFNHYIKRSFCFCGENLDNDNILCIVYLRSLPIPGRFFFQKINFLQTLKFCSIAHYKRNRRKQRKFTI